MAEIVRSSAAQVVLLHSHMIVLLTGFSCEVIAGMSVSGIKWTISISLHFNFLNHDVVNTESK